MNMMAIVGGVKMEKSEAIALCKKNMHRYVMAQMKDGMVHDGIVESVDDENLYLAVPTGEADIRAPAPVENNPHHHNPHHHNCGDYDYRAYGAIGGFGGSVGVPGYGGYGYGTPGYSGYPGYGYGYPGYGYGYPGYGYGYYGPRRRFRRIILPLLGLTALSLLPYY
jgi:hypothetical protein